MKRFDKNFMGVIKAESLVKGESQRMWVLEQIKGEGVVVVLKEE